MSVQNILERQGAEVFTVNPTATVRTAAQPMRARGIAAVVKGADLINGLISERDIVHAPTAGACRRRHRRCARFR
jgi:CBS domain-containing protein